MSRSLLTFLCPSWSQEILYKRRDNICKVFYHTTEQMFHTFSNYAYWKVTARILITTNFSRIIFKCGKKYYLPKLWYEFDYGDSGLLYMCIMDHLMSWSIMAFVRSFFKWKPPNARIENHSQCSHIYIFYHYGTWQQHACANISDEFFYEGTALLNTHGGPFNELINLGYSGVLLSKPSNLVQIMILACYSTQALCLYSLGGRTSYCKISRSLEAARLYVIMIASPCNLTGISTVLLLWCLSNLRAIGKSKAESRGFETSRYVAVRRPSVRRPSLNAQVLIITMMIFPFLLILIFYLLWSKPSIMDISFR